ncbi:glycosyltransferase family 4 protein [Pseudofulvibacter geojedonensis]|uniref:Glycosyltransferase family 4 protein n=1 Tax=Pseudofulvibacter geojedonensis TaxID=1123758 RepID=A0ABW3I4B0_9FLAO
MSKNIWLINQYLCTPELNGDGHRHSFLAEEFIKNGYDVTLITSSFSHVPKRENKFKGLFKITGSNIRTLLIKGNIYKETQGVARILSWLLFCFLLFFIPTKKLPKPDVIIVSSNSLLPILNVVFFFKRKFKGVKFILEIRDVWPLSLIELGSFSTKNIFIRFLAWVEKLGYKHADHIVSLLIDVDKHVEKILKSKDFNYTWISNGYQIEDESYYQPLPERIKNKIPKDKFVVGYAGSLGIANAMEFVIDAVKDNPDVCLCILGNGNEALNLRQLAKDHNNIIFFDRIPKNQVNSFLKECDLLYFASRNLKLYELGISANKTFDYMYAERPILLSAPTKNNIVDIANCGKVIPAESIDDIRKSLVEFKKHSVRKRKELGNNGKEYLLKYFTYDKLAKIFIKTF